MPVPTSISELSTTPGSNSPSGSDSPSVLDDHQRTAYAFIKTLSDAKAAIADTVLLTGNQTIAGTKTFSSPIVGNATNVTGTVAIANGGTGATTAAAAFTALKQAASDTATGVVELATDAETQAGTDTSRAITAANLKAAQIRLGTAVTASGTSVDFTGIPSWAKRLKLSMTGLSTNGTSPIQIQLGDSGGVETTGYAGTAGTVTTTANATNHTTGFRLNWTNETAGNVYEGHLYIELHNPATNTWTCSGSIGRSDAAAASVIGGSKSLSAALDRLRVTTFGGSDTFDAGTLNISWE